MTYIIGDACIGTNDQSCVDVCPVDCIIPAGRMLVIDPDGCIDCGSCVPACPVSAIVADTSVPDEWQPFVAINAAVADGVAAVDALLERHLAARDAA